MYNSITTTSKIQPIYFKEHHGEEYYGLQKFVISISRSEYSLIKHNENHQTIALTNVSIYITCIIFNFIIFILVYDIFVNQGASQPNNTDS